MLDKWIESVFLKRAVLAGSAAIAAHVIAFQSAPAAAHAFAWLSNIGLTVTVVVDQSKFAHSLTVGLFALTQGAQEWVAAKYPNAGKYL